MSKNSIKVYCRICGTPTFNKVGCCSSCRDKAQQLINLLEVAKICELIPEPGQLERYDKYDY